DLEAAPGKLVGRLERLIAVGVAREGDHVALPARTRELAPEELGGVALDHDLAIEIGASPPAEVLMRGPRIAVGASVQAASIRVDAEAKPHVRALVLGEDRPGVLFVYPQ